LYDAVAHDRKVYVTIEGATHYYAFQKAQLAECVSAVETWLETHDLRG